VLNILTEHDFKDAFKKCGSIEFLAANPEVLGSIPGVTRFSE
jgi:hypothetical protein